MFIYYFLIYYFLGILYMITHFRLKIVMFDQIGYKHKRY